MEEATGQGSSNVGKHTQRTVGIDAEGVTVQYSDSIRQKFAGLHDMVQNSEHFDGWLAEGLRELAGSREANVKYLLPALLALGKETTRYVAATGDERAKQYLTDLITEMSNERGTEKPIVLLKGRPASNIEMS